MGFRGPAPVSAKILELRGSNRATRGGEEPTPDARPPRMPHWMPKDGRPVFRELVRQLRVMGIVGRCDQMACERYVAMYLRWLNAEVFLITNGQTYVIRGRGKKNAAGEREPGPIIGVKTYPQVRIVRTLSSEMQRFEDRFGLSPSARARLKGVARLDAAPNAAVPTNPNGKARFFAAG